MTNRAERRAKARRTKGGSGVSIHFGPQKEPSYSPVLDYMVKANKRAKMERVLRSKNVPGY